LFGASGAALLVPGAIAAALILLAFAGGFGRLSSLGQALSGPSLPGVTPVGATLAGGKPALGSALAAAVLTGNAAARTVSGGSTRASTLAGTGVSGVTRTSGGNGSGSGGASGGSGGSGAPGAGPGVGTGSPPPTPAPPTLVDGVVNLGTSITSTLPGPVGAVATQTLQSLGSTVDRVLPLGGSSALAASSKRGPQLP
jgi:hypothetical protein